MKLMVPLSKAKEADQLLEAGAEELYCGLVTKEWAEKFTYISSINARHTESANLSSFKELEEVAKKAKKFGVPVFLTLNSHFYSEKQWPLALEQAEKAASLGIEWIIVNDLAFALEVKEKFPELKLCMGTGGAAFNSKAIEFYHSLGIERVVLPRHLTMDEVKILREKTKKLNIQLENFILNTQCPFIDGLCSFQHIVEEKQSFGESTQLCCRQDFEVKIFSAEKNPAKLRTAAQRIKFWSDSEPRDCGLCGMYFFHKYGIDSVKIIGREHSLEKKLADLRVVKEARNLLKKKISLNEFREKMNEKYFELFRGRCSYKNCFYPSAGNFAEQSFIKKHPIACYGTGGKP